MTPDDSRPPRRRRPRRDAAPLFEEQEEPARPAESGCAVPGCKLKPTPESRFCILHEALDGGKKKWQQSQRAAAKRGDTVASVGWQLLGGLVDLLNPAITEMVSRAAEDPAGAAERARQATGAAYQYVRGAPPAPPPPRLDPFAVLGLDPGKATASDVKAMQRKLAAIYHSDKGGTAVNASKLAEINAAADECLKLLCASP